MELKTKTLIQREKLAFRDYLISQIIKLGPTHLIYYTLEISIQGDQFLQEHKIMF